MSRRRSPASRPPSVRGKRQNYSPSRTPQDNVRASAAWVVERTLTTMSPVSVFLESALAGCDERDHGLLRELTLGTLRWRRRLDDVISQASHRSFKKIEDALHAPLRIAAYQLLFLDRIPSHAAVHEGVEQARLQTHRGGASFANAVLRRIAKQRDLKAWPVKEQDPVRKLAIEMSHPDFLVERWMQRLGEEKARELLIANNRQKSLQLLAFRDRGGRELLAENLIDEGIDVEPSLLSPQGLIVRSGNPLHTRAYHEGDLYLQDEASQAAALIPPPRPGERVLDAAAAPGGKSFSLLAVEPEIHLYLWDVSPGRTLRMRENLLRLRRPFPFCVADATRPPTQHLFDRVIVDLPCTGTGTLRKNPELKWRISPDEVGRLSRQALRMLEGVADLVEPGGCLSAITCSLEPEENEEVIAQFLDRRQDYSPLMLEDALSFPLRRFVCGPGMWRIFPEEEHDGFTVHVLERTKSAI